MPSLNIGDGIEFFSEDSGAILGTTYTTLIFVHGMGFNGGVFEPLFDVASKHNFRIVSLYRRDYPPTTPLKESERTLLARGPEGQSQFLLGQGVGIARFIEEFIHQNNIPPADTQSRVGGVVLVGWSLGSVIVHAMISHLDSLSTQSRDHLGKYLHTVIIHDATSGGMGLVNPSENNLDRWSEVDARKRFELFKDWVTAYFDHQDIDSRNIEKIEFNNFADRPHTFQTTPFGELAKLTSFEAYRGSDTVILFIDLAVSRENIRRALFDKSLASNLPNLRVRYFHGGETPGILVWSLWQLENALRDPTIYDGEQARDIEILYSSTGNHFIFWDQPEEALVQYRRCIDA